MNFDNYKFRCSQLGKIVTKSGKLTDGARTYLTECFIEAIYGVRKEAYGKALEKGIACEQDGLKLLNDTLYPGRFVKKITEATENDFIKGTPDAVMDNVVYDIKNAYDRFTFGKADLTHDYQWQLKGYLWLYGLDQGRVFYCLNNMPDHMISEEERSMFYKQRKWISFDDPEYLEACNQLREAHNYDAMPPAFRFKIFDVTLTEEDEAMITECVGWARKTLNKMYREHQDRLKYNVDLMQQARTVAEK